MKSLRAAGIEHIVILTGDNERVARSIARQVGADEVCANLLPEHKVEAVKAIEAAHGTTAMVGDGVNDAPALASATIGIAMGAAGTDVALETADVVLMSDDLSNIAYAMHLSRHARRVVYQNLTFSLGVIAVLVISALGFNLALPFGVVGHEGSTVIVVTNGLRLLSFSRKVLTGI
jgi:Cd2+/Zn2+-exporting ATPase